MRRNEHFSSRRHHLNGSFWFSHVLVTPQDVPHPVSWMRTFSNTIDRRGKFHGPVLVNPFCKSQ